MTVAFWVKSNKTGTSQLTVKDSDNDRQVAGTYAISSADTWEHKVVNLPADTSGAITDDSGLGFRFEWWLGAGSTYSGGAVPTAWEARASGDRGVSNLAINDNTANDWAITGVQVEVGEYSSTTLPPFQHESYGDNLKRCQRYAYEVVSNESSAGNAPIGTAGIMYSSSQMMFNIPFPVPMRTNPSLTCSSGSNYYQFLRDSAADSFDDFVIDKANSNLAEVKNSTDMSGTAGQGGMIRTQSSSLSVLFTAEL